MKHRTWLLEALHLHFDENLARVEAGRRLGIPKTTVCDLFVRFRKAGLSWPLPPAMSEQKLDECLYRSLSSAPPVPVVTVTDEKPNARKRIRRPNFPRAFKIALVEKSLQPGTNVAQLARENGINDNLLFNWRSLYRKGLLLPHNSEPALLPVMLSAEPGRTVTVPSSGPENTSGETLCCELVLPSGTVRLKGTLTAEMLQVLIREMKRGSRCSPFPQAHASGWLPASLI
ncbi:IS66-like element accessory protein TnpA [Pantoea stewartii]|uniref:IS66-like element accessory protein TnpA n=1 Tax=Pantoea stewartii TaxID=66269 RepID=UPI0033690325